MKAVLISIQPKWCEKIARSEKTIEVRKTVPREFYREHIRGTGDIVADAFKPFKCYIYETLGKYLGRTTHHEGVGKVIGEFVCDRIDITTKDNIKAISKASCVSLPDLWEYGRQSSAYGLYGWHISELKIYDKPKELSEFVRVCDEWKKEEFTQNCRRCGNHERNDADMCYVCAVEGEFPITRPPQSWCYVEEV